MAVSLNFCLAQQCDCKTALFTDTTGVYLANVNDGGWGAPNTLTTAITSATIQITPKGYILPITFTFTIANDVITLVERSDEFGVITDVTALINPNSLVFPFYEFEFNSELLFNASPSSDLSDGSYLVTYECTDGSQVFSNQQWIFFTCLSKRCKDDTVVRGSAGHVTTENQIKIFLNYEYLLGGVSLGDKDFVDAQVDAMASLCLSCGCGCGC
jgi:hypothetical protein